MLDWVCHSSSHIVCYGLMVAPVLSRSRAMPKSKCIRVKENANVYMYMQTVYKRLCPFTLKRIRSTNVSWSLHSFSVNVSVTITMPICNSCFSLETKHKWNGYVSIETADFLRCKHTHTHSLPFGRFFGRNFIDLYWSELHFGQTAMIAFVVNNLNVQCTSRVQWRGNSHYCS